MTPSRGPEHGRAQPAPLDDPAPRHRALLRNPFAGDAFGRAAEGFARMMGTPAFLVGMTLLIAGAARRACEPEAMLFDIPAAKRHTDKEQPARLEHAYQLPDRLAIATFTVDVLDDRHRVDDVELAGPKG